MKKTIEAAVSMAYAYLIGTEWVEFSTLRHGPSTAVDWIGGYIRRCLPDLPGMPIKVFNRFSAKSSNDLDSEANWALALGRPLLGWFHNLNNLPQNWHEEHQGLSTYSPRDIQSMYQLPEEGACGWLSTHFEVTALALQCKWKASPELHDKYILWEHDDEENFPERDREFIDVLYNSANNWILDALRDGSDTSYWWSTDSYGWSLATQDHWAKLLVVERLQDADPLRNRYGEICPFTMALSLMTWLDVIPDHEIILPLAERLLEMQQSDGSWRAPAILRIPEPHVIRPTPDCRRALEDKGLLTTATAAQALKRYKNTIA